MDNNGNFSFRKQEVLVEIYFRVNDTNILSLYSFYKCLQMFKEIVSIFLFSPVAQEHLIRIGYHCFYKKKLIGKEHKP